VLVLTVVVLTLSIVAVMVIQSIQQSELNDHELQLLTITTELGQEYTLIGEHLKLFSEHTSAAEFTFPDVGEDSAEIVLTKGDQSIDGNKTFVESVTISSSTIPLTLGSGTDQLKVDIGTSAAVRTYTVPDGGATAEFVLSEGAQTINGVKTLPDGIQLEGGTTLDYYEYVTVVANVYGPWAAAQPVMLHFHRVGKHVTLDIPAVSAVATVAAVMDTAATHPIPVRFRPRDYATDDVYVPVMIVDNGAIKQGVFRFVTNTGNFEIHLWDGTQLAVCTGSGATGFHALSISYLTS
jgi:hypothetical protein